MPEVVSECPVCSDPRSELFDRRMFRGFEVLNRICTRCGLVYQSPRMTPAELEKFYASEYRQIYQGNDGPALEDIDIQERRAEFLLNFIRKQGVNRVTHHLDIGSSAGRLLERLQSSFGCQSIGIEPGKAYREYAQSRGLMVFGDIDSLFAEEEMRFDLITMAHVLEHLPDPLSFLRVLHQRILTDDGLLLVEVPNLYAHDCFELAHMTSFSAFSLDQVIKLSGFQPMIFLKHGYPRSSVIPLYLTVIARRQHEIPEHHLKRESRVRVKRRIGLLRRRILSIVYRRKAWLSFPKVSS